MIAMKPTHLAFMVLVTLVWAMSLVAGSIGMEEIPPLLFTGLRFLLLALILLPFLDLHKDRMGLVVLIALTAGAFNFALFFGGIYVAGNLSAVTLASQLGVPFTALLSIFILREAVGWRRWTGIFLSFVGVMIIGFDPAAFSYMDGMLLGIAGAFVASISSVAMRMLKNVGVFELQAWIAMLSWPVLLGLSVAIEGSPVAALEGAGWRGWGGVAFTALVSNLIAHAGIFWLLQRYEVSTISPLTLLTPIWAVIFGVTLLGDTLTWRMALGGAVTLFGVGIVAIRSAKSQGVADMAGPATVTAEERQAEEEARAWKTQRREAPAGGPLRGPEGAGAKGAGAEGAGE